MHKKNPVWEIPNRIFLCLFLQLRLIRPAKDVVDRHPVIVAELHQQVVPRFPLTAFIPAYAVLIDVKIQRDLQLCIAFSFSQLFQSGFDRSHLLTQMYQFGIFDLSRFGIFCADGAQIIRIAWVLRKKERKYEEMKRRTVLLLTAAMLLTLLTGCGKSSTEVPEVYLGISRSGGAGIYGG